VTDLERQLRTYAETLDAAAPPVDELARVDRQPTSTPRRTPAWMLGVAAAAVVVAIVGSVAIVTSWRSPTEDPASTSITTSPTIPTESETTVPASIAPSEYLELVSDRPAYAGGDDGDVGGRPRVAAGPVAIVDGTYHTLFAAGGSDDVWEAVFHGTSSDGSTWTIDPVPTRFEAVVGASDLYVGSIGRLDDGTWVMYYHVAFDSGGHGNHVYEYAIGRATASSPGGPWTADPTEVLVPGADGAWDSASIRYPSVVRQGESWLMFYTGARKDESGEMLSAMGLATSRDGVVWEKLSEPVFTGDPRLAWEEGSVTRTDVIWTGDRYVLLYAGRTGGTRGLAISADGITWDRVDDDPVLSGFDVPRPAIFSTSMLADGDRIRVYVSNGGHRTTSVVYEMELTVP
jgi:hypothetical protein